MSNTLHAVTGAFGYSGKYIARRLLAQGENVVTLTNSAHRPNPFGDQIHVEPLRFEDPIQLRRSLAGVRTLYNTYWVRFNYMGFSHREAGKNSSRLIEAAKQAGVRRIVHLSITNPSADSPLEYFRGKAEVEDRLANSGMSYAILRPALLFGKEDILINNIAWALRTLPVFGLFGDGSYKVQPIFVEDLAKIAVNQGKQSRNIIIDAIGPETFSYRGLVTRIAQIIGHPRLILPLPPRLAYLIAVTIGRVRGDIMITWEEVRGLMANLLHVDSAPLGETAMTTWAAENANTLGRHYASELERRGEKLRPQFLMHL